MKKTTSWDLAVLLPHTDFSGNRFGSPVEINTFPYLKQLMDSVLNDKFVGKHLIYGLLLANEFRKDFQNVLTYVEGKLFFRNLNCQGGNPWFEDSVRYSGLSQWYRYHQNLRDIICDESKFAQIPYPIAWHEDLTAYDNIAYCVMKRYTDLNKGNYITYLSKKQLSVMLKCSINQVDKIKARLRKAGFISFKRKSKEIILIYEQNLALNNGDAVLKEGTESLLDNE